MTRADYTTASGAVTFLPGETSKTIPVTIAGDTRIEFDEQFFVDLAAPVNGTIGQARGTATILDDDQGVAASKLSINDVSVTEIDGAGRTAVFTVIGRAGFADAAHRAGEHGERLGARQLRLHLRQPARVRPGRRHHGHRDRPDLG